MNPARKLYLDNIRWMTVVLVVIYHVVYMFNGVQPFGVIGPFREHQLQDCFQYLVYPWFMALLFVVSGMSARYYLQSHTTKQFLKDKTRKLLVPSTIGLFVFQWLLGIENGYNYTGIAQKHKVGYQQIYTWVQKYKKDGEEGLKDRRGRHKKDYKPQTKEERLKLEVATLKRQLYLSQMEIDVLKKLQELERGNR